MIVVGLTGPVMHGKSSFAEYLGSHAASYAHFESSDLVIAVVNKLRQTAGAAPAGTDLSSLNAWIKPLPGILAEVVHADVSLERLAITKDDVTVSPGNTEKLFAYMQLARDNPGLASQPITADNKDVLRSIQQWVGGYLYLKAGEGIWYDEVSRLIAAERQKGTELTIVGGIRFPSDAERVRQRGGQIIELLRHTHSEPHIADLTERQRHSIKHDSIVYNDGSLEQLAACAAQVYADLQTNTLQPEYKASAA